MQKAAAAVYSPEGQQQTRALTDFCNEDLSAFFFDIRKDALYCEVGPKMPLGSAKRRAYRTVLDTLFHALIRYAAPVLVFTAEEVWAVLAGKAVRICRTVNDAIVGAVERDVEIEHADRLAGAVVNLDLVPADVGDVGQSQLVA